MSKYSEYVKQFNEAFKPECNYLYLIMEEFNEWYLEVDRGLKPEDELKELCDLLYVVCGYAEAQEWGVIEKNADEVKLIRESFKKAKEKFPDINLPLTAICTAYIELLCSKDFMWLYRLAQGIFAYAAEKGWPMDQAFKRVHDSNMTKLGEDGKPIRNADGKVVKGPNYKTADIKSLLKVTPRMKEGLKVVQNNSSDVSKKPSLDKRPKKAVPRKN